MAVGAKAAMSSKTMDRATCLYETEWQVTESVFPYAKDGLGITKKHLLRPQQHTIMPNDFLWASAEDPGKVQLVSAPSKDAYFCISFSACGLTFVHRSVAQILKCYLKYDLSLFMLGCRQINQGLS